MARSRSMSTMTLGGSCFGMDQCFRRSPEVRAMRMPSHSTMSGAHLASARFSSSVSPSPEHCSRFLAAPFWFCPPGDDHLKHSRSKSAMRLPGLDKVEGVNQVDDVEGEVVADCRGEGELD